MTNKSALREGVIVRLKSELTDIALVIKINKHEIHLLIKNKMQWFPVTGFLDYAEVVVFNDQVTQLIYPESEVIGIAGMKRLDVVNWEIPFCLSSDLNEQIKICMEQSAEFVCLCIRLKNGELWFPKYRLNGLFKKLDSLNKK